MRVGKDVSGDWQGTWPFCNAIKKVLTFSAQIAGEVQVMKKDLASSFEGLANRMVDSITDADILRGWDDLHSTP